jgi:hypothetical protein
MSLTRVFLAIFVVLLLLRATELVGQAMGWGLECLVGSFCR